MLKAGVNKMNIDVSIINDYLNDEVSYEKHWIFNSILGNNQYLFDKPSHNLKESISSTMKKVIDILKSFIPYNVVLFSKLFLNWKELSKNVNVILAVGCPKPYDAMIREHNEKDYIILDLVRLLDYHEDISEVIKKFFTHELIHVCIKVDYPFNIKNESSYKKILEYLVFDEGFAHLLSFKENVCEFDFSELIKTHYNKSIKQLKIALTEEELSKQIDHLNQANSGIYWNKFAAITGKLYLANNLNDLFSIYKAGPKTMLENIIFEE